VGGGKTISSIALLFVVFWPNFIDNPYFQHHLQCHLGVVKCDPKLRLSKFDTKLFHHDPFVNKINKDLRLFQ
jgi:hypothetical protein